MAPSDPSDGTRGTKNFCDRHHDYTVWPRRMLTRDLIAVANFHIVC